MKAYYPTHNQPLHEVRDWSKVRSMIRALRSGENLPPVYAACGFWLSGTHRVAASEIRAMLDGRSPYQDLEIIDLSPRLKALSDDDLETFNRLDPEDALEFLLGQSKGDET